MTPRPSRRGLDYAPPYDALIVRRIREPQLPIAVAWLRRAEANNIAAPQFVECAQELTLIREPALIFCDDRGAVTVGSNSERIT